MKLLIDNNLPPWWAETLQPYCSIHHEVSVYALSKILKPNTPDIDVFNYIKGDDWLILTQDKYRNRLEREVLHSCKVRAYNLHGWHKYPMGDQLSKMFKAIPRIIISAKSIKGGGVFFVSYRNAEVYLP